MELEAPAVERKFLLFYSAYFLKCLEERIWWFCLVTSLAELGGLVALAVEQVLEGVLQVAASTYLGTLIDRFSRKRGLITILILNNFTLVFAVVSLIVSFSIHSNLPWYTRLLPTMLLSAFNRLFLNSEKSMLGKDWLLVIKGETKLSTLNWWLQLFDQTANVMSPIYAGWVLTKEKRATSLIGLWMLGLTLVATMSLRSVLLGCLYQSNNDLATSKEMVSASRTPRSSSPLQIFFRQESFLAAFGACMLFMTVMGFGSVAIGYATKANVPKDTIGYLKALAAIMGLVGGGLYAVLERNFGVRTSGIVGLILQQTFIVLVVGSVLLPGSSMDICGYFESFKFENWFEEVRKSFNRTRSARTENNEFSWLDPKSTSILVFLVASAFTLIGQSCLETSIKHIMQTTVPENERNTVFGVQNSISKGFTMLKDLMVIGFQSPAIFAILIFCSYIFVSTGHLFYVWYVVRSKKTETEMVSLNEEQKML